MSRNKRTSSRQSPAKKLNRPSANGPRRYRLRWIILAVIGVIAVAFLGYDYACRASARADFAQARELLREAPHRSEHLAERAVWNAYGNYPAAQLLQSRALAATGQWSAALGGMLLIKDFSTCDAVDLLSLGESAIDASEWKLAELSLEQAANKSGEASSRATELLVKLDLRFQRPADALKRCRAWQRSDPDSPTSWAIAGDIETAAIHFGEAIDDFRQALKRSPSPELTAQVRSSLAQLLVHTGDSTGARIEFEKLIASAPLTGKLQLSYVQLLRMEGRNTDALAEVNGHISRSGESSENLKLRGMLYLDEGNVDAALRDLKESVKGNAFDIAAQHKLAQAYIQAGDPTSAQPHLERGRQMAEATSRLSDVEDALRKDPSNTELLQERKSLQAILGR